MENLTYADHETWFASFVARVTTAPRLRAVSDLPRHVSSGWLATLERARTLAIEEGQRTVAKRLESRIRAADSVTDAGDAGRLYTCPGCGHLGPIDDFGYRVMSRKAKQGPDGAPVLRPNWHVVEIGDFDGKKYPVKIRVKQSRCNSCR